MVKKDSKFDISENKHTLSLAECKKILQSTGRTYTEEEVKKIRELLYQLAHIEVDYYQRNLVNIKDAQYHSQ